MHSGWQAMPKHWPGSGWGWSSSAPGAIAVRETPAMLGEMNVQQLIRDLADEIAEHDTADGLKAMLHHVAPPWPAMVRFVQADG
ncbi:hypothetical protein VXQ18_03325 [Brucella abortus]|nr:hypothetical protein [Brucella abortus]